jgi:hypothetical protein
MPEKIVNVSLRVPESLHQELSEWAELEHRSLHGQIVHTLRDALLQRVPTIALGPTFDLAKEMHGWDDGRLAEHLGISSDAVAELATKSIPTNGKIYQGGRLVPDRHTPDVGSVWLLAERYGMDEEHRDRLLRIIAR